MKTNIWLKYTVVLIIVLGLIAAAGFVLFFRSIDYLDSSATTECYSQLHSYRIDLDSRLREVEAVVDQLCNSTEIQNLSANPDLGDGRGLEESVFVVHEVIRTYVSSNDFIEDVLVYFPASDVVLTTDQSFSSMADCYGDAYYHEGYTLSEWVDLLCNSEYERSVIPGHEATVAYNTANHITFVQTVPAASGKDPAYVVALSVREDSFVEPMINIVEPYNGYGFVLWRDNVIASSCMETPLQDLEENAEYLSMELLSDYSDIRYMFMLNASTLQESVKRYRTGGLIVMNISLFLSVIVLVAFLARRISSLNKILSRLCYRTRSKERTNELEFIHTSVDNLFQINEALQQKVDSFQQLVVNEFWANLLSGQIITQSDAQYYRMQMEPLDMDHDYLAVAFRICGIHELDLELVAKLNKMKVYLDEQVQTQLARYCVHTCNTGPLMQVAICRAPAGHGRLSDCVNSVKAVFESMCGNKVDAIIGKTVPNLMEISLSFNDAVTRLHSSPVPQMPCPATIPSYPLTIMHKANLVRMLKSGMDDEVSAYLQRIFDENYPDGDQPEWIRPQYAHALLSALLLAYNDLRHNPAFPHEEFAERIEQAYRCTDIDEQLNQIQAIQHMFSVAVVQIRANPGSALLDKVCPFIHENLCDYNLSLEMVADHFHVSKAYLSAHFKERSGENFSNYVEKLRIEASCKLIRQGQYRINDVAQQVGYNSAQVYRRAFKRVMGVSPRQYMTDTELV